MFKSQTAGILNIFCFISEILVILQQLVKHPAGVFLLSSGESLGSCPSDLMTHMAHL